MDSLLCPMSSFIVWCGNFPPWMEMKRMPSGHPGKLLRLHMSEHDRYRDGVLYEAIVAKCLDLGVAGVTVFRGLESYGESSEIHRSHLLVHDQPIVITIVETPHKTEEILPELLD